MGAGTGFNQSSLTATAGLTYQGTWNASTNTPTLVSSVGTQGDYYIVSVAGSTNLNGIADWGVSDWAIFSGSVWQKIDNSETPSWQLNGNTVVSEKYIGTIDNFDFPIRTNNVARAKISSTGVFNVVGNSFFGNLTTAPTSRIHGQGSTDDSSAYALKLDNLSGSPILYGRNDGLITINKSSATFSQSKLSVEGWAEITSAGVAGLTLFAGTLGGYPVSGFFNQSASNTNYGSVFINETNGNMQFGGIGYAQQSAITSAKFEFALNYLGELSGQQFIISDGLHTIDTGGSVSFYGAANSASNVLMKYGEIGSYKENATDVNTKSYTGFKINNGSIVVEAARFDSNSSLVLTGRLQQYKGANVAAANDLTLGLDGNFFTITGNTQINAITTANWHAGSPSITLLFTGTPTVKNNTAGGAGTGVLLLSGSADLLAANNTMLGLQYDGTQWQETFRKVA